MPHGGGTSSAQHFSGPEPKVYMGNIRSQTDPLFVADTAGALTSIRRKAKHKIGLRGVP